MEVHNYHRSEAVHRADGPLGGGIAPHGSGTSLVPSPVTSSAPQFRPYPVIVPVYTPVISEPLYVQTPIDPPLLIVENRGAPAAKAPASTPSATKTTIFGLTPVAGGVLVLSVLAISVTVYKKWDSISKIFK